MALVPLGPPGAAPPAPPPQGFAAVKADAGLTVGGMRDMIAVARDFMQLLKEAQPMLSMLRPPEPVDAGPAPSVVLQDAGPQPGRAPDPGAARAAASAPPASEVDAARAEEVAKARADLAKLLKERLSKAQILQLASAFGPLALGEKLPKLAEALGNHAAEVDALLNALSEEELHGIIGEALPLIPAKDVPLARMGVLQAVQAFEKEAAQAKPQEPAAQPAEDAEPEKEGEGA